MFGRRKRTEQPYPIVTRSNIRPSWWRHPLSRWTYSRMLRQTRREIRGFRKGGKIL
jgi:hypothetical protein